MTALPNHIRTPQQQRRQAFRNRGLCTQCGAERTQDGRALGPDCLAYLAAKRDACKPMKTADAAPHYLPLAAAPFRAFADGTKRTEYRRAGARFSLRNFPTGRAVILANGYAPKDHPTRTLRAVVTGFEVVAFDKLPRDIADSVLHYLDNDENPIEPKTLIACIGLEVGGQESGVRGQSRLVGKGAHNENHRTSKSSR